MRQRHRIFIAINLPDDIKRSLISFQERWPELPARWAKPENLHITLNFLGYVTDEELVEILKNTQEITLKHSAFDINLNKICYGPPKKMPPRMVWAIGPKIKEFNFTPHITLGRIKQWEWRRIEPEDKPEIDQDIDLKFRVNSIEAMESVLKRGGPEYIILESFKFRSF